MAKNSLRNVCVGVVEDDESARRSLARLLRAAGMQPTTYASAEELQADTRHPRFDCLVLDVQLLGMSGLDLQRQLSEEGDATPVLFITAHDDPKARAQAMAGGCQGFFRKTAPGGDLLDAIRRVV
ncbi:MAG TPA: response regulator [Lamprocystis sp. (in: g-proteobacteria)]|nr:response regulator [Lamprocystis sp. (in: g-proteobacteria)]